MGDDYYKVPCPHCEQQIEFPTHGVGQTVECPTCNGHLLLAVPTSSLGVLESKSQQLLPNTSWKNDQATEKQLSYLKQFGYNPERFLTKGEASDLIAAFEDNPERNQVRDDNWAHKREAEIQLYSDSTAWFLHEKLNNAKLNLDSAVKGERAYAKADLNECLRERIEFWASVFSSSDSDLSVQCLSLWERHGRHYKNPGVKKIKILLEALDAHTPDWDKFAPESFFHTLKENFPDLQR